MGYCTPGFSVIYPRGEECAYNVTKTLLKSLEERVLTWTTATIDNILDEGYTDYLLRYINLPDHALLSELPQLHETKVGKDRIIFDEALFGTTKKLSLISQSTQFTMLLTLSNHMLFSQWDPQMRHIQWVLWKLIPTTTVSLISIAVTIWAFHV